MKIIPGKLTMKTIDAANDRKADARNAAQKRTFDAKHVSEAEWAEIMSRKNSVPDADRLKRLKAAMDSGLIERNPSEAVNAKGVVKKFSKAEALRLFNELVIIERESKLAEMVETTPENYVMITDYESLREMLDLAMREPIIAFDTETTGLDTFVDVIVGYSVTIPSVDRHYYVPITPTQDVRALDSETVLEMSRPLFESTDVRKVLHNAAYDIKMLERHGIRMGGLYWDTMPGMVMLNENEPTFALKNLATKYLREPADTFAELFGKDAKFAEIPLDVALVYAAKDTHVTWKMYEFQLEHLSKMPKVLEYFLTVEVPLIEVVVQMENTGFDIDIDYAAEYGVKMKAAIDRLHAELQDELGDSEPDPNRIEVDDIVIWESIANGPTEGIVIGVSSNTIRIKSNDDKNPYPTKDGLVTIPTKEAVIIQKRERRELNINSHVQLKAALEAATGLELESTNASKVLKPLAATYSVIRKLVAYKELTKLYGTYISVLPTKIHPVTGKLHARFNPNGAVTGRFSSGGNGVNLQNQPRDARPLFVAPPGWVLVGADFKAQEIRCAAYFTQEPLLVEAFASGKDPYAMLASEYYKKPYDKCNKNPDGSDTVERKAMKVGMLASLYGTGPTTLAGQLGGSVDEAKEFLKTFFETYQGITSWLDETKAFAKKNGFVWLDKQQRKRRLPDAKKSKRGRYYVPEIDGALRQGPNARIQGTSAIQTKVTLIKLAKVCKERGWKLWATIHDEIIVLMPDTFTMEDIQAYEDVMVNSYSFGNVANGTDIEVGTRWGELVPPHTWFEQNGVK